MSECYSLWKKLDQDSKMQFHVAHTLVYNTILCLYQRGNFYNDVHNIDPEYFNILANHSPRFNNYNLDYDCLNGNKLKGSINFKGNHQIFLSLILSSSLIGVTYPIVELLENKTLSYFIQQIVFQRTNQNFFENYKKLLKVIRNTLVHNIDMNMAIRKEDFIGRGENQFWKKDVNDNKPFSFNFDYSESPFNLTGCDNIKLEIRKESIEKEPKYVDVISNPTNIQLLKFSYLMMDHIWENNIPESERNIKP